MGNRTNISKIAAEFWVDLLKQNRKKMAEKNPSLNAEYCVKEWKENIENFQTDLEIYIKAFFPRHERLLLINCIGRPCSDLKTLLDRNGIDDALMKGEIIEMEISSNKLMVYNRKENTSTCLYERKNLFDEQNF